MAKTVDELKVDAAAASTVEEVDAVLVDMLDVVAKLQTDLSAAQVQLAAQRVKPQTNLNGAQTEHVPQSWRG